MLLDRAACLAAMHMWLPHQYKTSRVSIAHLASAGHLPLLQALMAGFGALKLAASVLDGEPLQEHPSAPAAISAEDFCCMACISCM